jgi:hypothetical protein
VTENKDYATAEEIDDMFPGLGVEPARRVIDFARSMSKRMLLDSNVPRHGADTNVEINSLLGTSVPGAN